MEIQLAAEPAPEDNRVDDEVRRERALERVASTEQWGSGALWWSYVCTGEWIRTTRGFREGWKLNTSVMFFVVVESFISSIKH